MATVAELQAGYKEEVGDRQPMQPISGLSDELIELLLGKQNLSASMLGEFRSFPVFDKDSGQPILTADGKKLINVLALFNIAGKEIHLGFNKEPDSIKWKVSFPNEVHTSPKNTKYFRGIKFVKSS